MTTSYKGRKITFSITVPAFLKVEFDDELSQILDWEVEDYNQVIDGIWGGKVNGVFVDEKWIPLTNTNLEEALETAKEFINIEEEEK